MSSDLPSEGCGVFSHRSYALGCVKEVPFFPRARCAWYSVAKAVKAKHWSDKSPQPELRCSSEPRQLCDAGLITSSFSASVSPSVK